MQKNLIRLLVSLSLVSNLSYAETTNNLVSQDFTSGWTNTTNTYHGSGTIAGHHGGTVTSDSVSLSNDVGLNKNEINQGFTVNSSANVWFWNNYDQSVTMTTQAIDDNGQTITQTRTLSGTCATFNGCDFGAMTDKMVFNSNTQADYDLSLGFSFSVTDTNYQSGHWAADLKDPSMTVTYTPINLDSTTETALLDLSKDITDDLKDVQSVEIKEEAVVLKTDTLQTAEVETKESLSTSDLKETVKTDTVTTDTTKDQASTTELSETKDDQDATSGMSTLDQSETQEEKTENKESESNTATTSENQEKESNTQGTQEKAEDKKESLSLSGTMDKIDANIKDVGKNLEMKNQVLHSALIDNSLILSYQIPFYKERKIYENQIDIRDNRILYANTSLVSYTQNDPVYQKQNLLYNIRQEKQKLINEIKVLKNAR